MSFSVFYSCKTQYWELIFTIIQNLEILFDFSREQIYLGIQFWKLATTLNI